MGLAIVEIFDILMGAITVAKRLRQEAPSIYEALETGQTQHLNWAAALLPDLPGDASTPPPDQLSHNLECLVRVHEGVRFDLYADTAGKWTIGCGRNLSDRGISPDEADYLLSHDIADTVTQLHRAFPWVVHLSPVRQAVLADMLFNMGLGNRRKGLLSFQQTLQLIQQGDYAGAASAMLKSKWRTQVGQRAVRLATMMATNEWPRDIEGIR